MMNEIYKPILGLVILAVIVFGAMMLPAPTADAWKIYENEELGISFSYPPEWGSAEYKTYPDNTISFSSNSNVFAITWGGDVALRCPIPKMVQDDAYCRIYTNDNEYLYEFVSIQENSLWQRVFVEDFSLQQRFPELNISSVSTDAYLQSILDRTADPAILDKIDTFEKVMLTLEVD